MDSRRLATPNPAESERLVQQAVVALDQGNTSAAAAFASQALNAAESALAWEVLAIALLRSGQPERAVDAGRRAVALAPHAADFHTNLGVALRAIGRAAEAEAAYRRAIACNAGFAPAHHNLANLLRDIARLAEAERSYREAVSAKPDYGEAWHGLGVVLQRQGRGSEAVAPLREAVRLQPRRADAASDLATCLMGLDRQTEAHELLTKALGLDPNLALAHGNLGALYLKAGRLIDAESATRRAAELAPDEPRWVTNLAVLAKDLGRFDESEGLFRRALAMKPDYALAHANLLFCLNYHPDRSADAILSEYRRFDDAHARRHMPADLRFDNDRTADRRLRVGLLSPDFREHSARHFIEPLLAHYDRARIELYCYAEVANPDAVTAAFQRQAGHWRSTVGLSDDELAALVRRDRIDILMDLGGHTSASRLLAMARKPAPVQIAYLLGHGYTSGLSAVDAFLADKALVPEGSEALFTERVVRLPRIPIAYSPPQAMPEVGPLPALAKGHVTFGYFGRPERINARVVAAWSQILKGVPSSRLMLNSKAFLEPAYCALMADRFQAHGIGRDCLEMVFTSPQPRTWSAYGEVDMALDPFPHNAGTTTIEALWLGVPVVTVEDRPSVGRLGASILASAGLTDWVARSVEGYIALAILKARNLASLAALRSSLRARLAASPLCDGAGLARDLEAAFRSLWSDWCQRGNAGDTERVALRQAARIEAQRLEQEGHPAQAAAVLEAFVARFAGEPDALVQLSDVYRRLGRLADAEHTARHALTLDPKAGAAANALGNALAALGRLLEAEAAFTTAIELKPAHAEALNNRALARMRRGQLVPAEEDLRHALALRPDFAEIGFNLANALQDQGRVPEAVDTFRATLAKVPGHARGQGMMLFSLTYHPGLSGDEIFAEFRRWNETHAAPLAPLSPQWANARGAARRLRVGYVSPDFATKSSRHFIEPMLVGHDRSKVEIFCYAEVPAPDAETERLKAFTEHWRSSVGLSDAELADLIRRDRIDVIVDLGGHTARNRLLALARKPAPVQIAHFLGHGYTSGLSVMDAFLADPVLAPEGADRLFSEPLVRLPRIPISYAPPEGMPDVASLPAFERGHVTFGHFGRVVRLNDRVVAAWARILAAVPRSRLVLNTVSFADAEVCRRYRDAFARHGIAPERLDLVFTTPQPRTWEAYAGIDIALDPFPHNGGTTTIEALWLGVPTVTLRDRPSVGRFGASILAAVGLDDWGADTIDAYVALAVAKASDLRSLASLRAGLRTRMAASPLCDAEGLAAALEDVYFDLWRRYAARETEIDRLQAAAGKAYGEGNHVRAAELFEAATKIAPRADILTNLGAALRSAGRVAEAETAYREAIGRDPGFAAAHGNLGNLLMDRGRLAESKAAFERALELAPDEVQVRRNLGLCLMRQSRFEEARPHLERARELLPENGDIIDNLAQLLRQLGQPVAAARLYDQSRPLFEGNWRAVGNMALLAQDLGRFDESEGLFRRALAMKPDYALAHANLLFCLNYHPDRSADAILSEYRRFDDAHARRHMPADLRFDNDRTADRRLRVGLLSPDFREHSARHFIEPLLAHYDRARIELYCYAEVANPDAVTAAFQRQAGHWRSTVGLSDDELAALVRRDRIDILMDLGGHTSASRLLAMARKPAPVQIAYLLGHGYTSGLSAVDAFLADKALVPEGSEALFTERVVRLPRIPIAYSPPQAMPEVGPLPALAKGHVTFGYFGRPERINARVVAAWSQILKGVPSSRLMLNSKAFLEPAYCALMADRFQAHGIGRDCLEMVFTSPQPRTWSAYGEVDMALDPFPHNAGTTTIEALWLGVPVVTVEDRPSVGRLGASILASAGLTDWVARSVEGYIALAILKARNLASLAALRSSLRARLAASPLCDGAGLARDLEAAFRSLWSDWCQRGNAQAGDWLKDAVAALQSGQYDRARTLIDDRLARAPSDGEAYHLRGIISYRQGRLPEAAGDLASATRELPERADIRWNLTAILRAQGRLADAETQGREATRLAPDAPEAHNNLASVLKGLGRQGEAEAHLRRAIALRPGYADAWCNLAWTLSLAGNAREAESAARTALELNPQDPNALNNLGTALMQQDRLREAGDCFERAVALKPDFAIAHSNLLFCLNYRTDLTPERIFAAYRGWDAAHAGKLRQPAGIYRQSRDPSRRLRVGYVSADFRHHAVSFFMEPLLAAHDTSKVEVTCYAEVANPDAVTERFKRHAGRWRSTVGLSDAALADLIRADEIDVLVDLSGHTGGNRLLTFARKPAPVQIAHMVGSGTTTGLSAIDAFLADAALVPRGAERFFSEKVMRLSRIPLVYAAPEGMPPVAPLPALRNGYVTFGCFSRTARINDSVVGAWAGIMNAVPGSRLLLNSKPFRESEAHGPWRSRFALLGVAPERIDLVYTSPQPETWKSYAAVDIALDPFPHNAGTTTIEALWLGVPVVSLASRPPVGRFGAAILGSLGLDDWVAGDVAAYMRKAVIAASDVSELARVRSELRSRFVKSPLGGDGAALAREIEAVYRSLWTDFCSRAS